MVSQTRRHLKAFHEDIAEEPAFPPLEYEGRVEAARQAMALQGIETLILFDPQSVCYFSGYSSVNLWDVCAVIVPQSGEVRVVLWDFEVPRFEASGGFGEPVTYPSFADPVEAVLNAVRDLGVRTYAVDQWTPFASAEVWSRLRQGLAPVQPCDARPVLWATRLRKSPAELAVLREAAALTDVGVAAAVEAIAVGVTDREVAAAATAAMLAAGSQQFSIQPIVAVGPRAGIPHSESSGRVITSGDGVFLEMGGSVHRYTAPIMRTVAVAEPHEDLVYLASLASRMVEAVVATMRPGASCAEVAAAALNIFADEGDQNILFHGSLGYSVGVSFPPSWLENLDFTIREGITAVIEQGMVFHVPLSLRRSGVRGVGLSYTATVDADGATVLNGTPAELIFL